MKRRTFLGGATAVSIGALLIKNGWVDAAGYFGPNGVDLDGLRAAGFDIRHTNCMQCGALCGMTGLVKTNAPPSEKNFFIFGNQNPECPQRGMCGRGATASQTWNSPLRLKKPLKLVGPRGSGQFQEVSWEQALDEIAARLKGIIDEHGARSVCCTGHNMLDEVEWFHMGIGTPNAIGQASTCNTAGVVARRWMMGPGFHHHAVVDPDYDNARFILFAGRTLHAPIGAQTRFAKARAKGARAAFLNPAHPDSAYANGEWIPCRPGTDAAFLLGLANVLVNENRYDEDFARRYTNLPLLLKPDGLPLTAADLEEGGDENSFRAYDPEAGGLVQHDNSSAYPVLAHSQQVTLADGSEIEVTTVWNRFVAHLADYTPSRVATICDVPQATVVRIARTLHTAQGVVEDTWYNTRNGTSDTDAIMALMTVNGLLGNFDKPGGLCFRPGHGMPGIIARDGDGKITTRLGHELELPPPGRRIDQELYPESNGTFEAVVKSVLDGDTPYEIKALWIGDATLFHRDPNTRRIEEMLRKIDFVFVTDILHQEICDWCDYVLPADMFLERGGLGGVSWTMMPSVRMAQPVTSPPPGADVRGMEWISLQLLKRIFPDRAYALGYEDRFVDPAVFNSDFLDRIDDRRIQAAAQQWDIEPAQLKTELLAEGFKNFRAVQYGNVPYRRPFASPSGRLEIYAFHPVRRGFREHGFARHSNPNAYTLPSGRREFYMVNGKSPSGSSATAALAFSSQYLAENAVWMNPDDASHLQIKNGDRVELEGLDTGWKAEATIKVTPRVHRGVLFTYSYVGGNRQRILKETKGFERIAEGINPHWFTTAFIDRSTGSGFNNASVRIRRLS
ncbi:MAG: molybdopterin-containing oxidoreductase family protein [Wenzhouxiangella sp.]